MFSFIASNASGPKRQRPAGLPRDHSTPGTTTARTPAALDHEYMLDTKSATVALRRQMRKELAEVEEDTRRQAGHSCRAPARRGEFLLAASILVQRRRDITVEDALALAQSQFVEQKVREALQHTQDKWKLIFERPAEFQLYDRRQEELMLHTSKLDQEERHDKSEARARVCKLCMFLTAGGKFLKEWRVAFEERAKLKRNGGVWTPNQFSIAVSDIARDVSGCKAPEGLAATIYEYMDTKSSRLVHVEEFFQLVQAGMRLEEAEKAEKANAKARVEKASQAAAHALGIHANDDDDSNEMDLEEEGDGEGETAPAKLPAAPEEEEEVEEEVAEGCDEEGEEVEYKQVFKDEDQPVRVGRNPMLPPFSRTFIQSKTHLLEDINDANEPVISPRENKSASSDPHVTLKQQDSVASYATNNTNPGSIARASPVTATPKPLRLDPSGWTEDKVAPHSPYVLSPVQNHVARRASNAVRGYRLEANDPDEHYTSLVAVDSISVGGSPGSGGSLGKPRGVQNSSAGTNSAGGVDMPSTTAHHYSSPWIRIMLHLWACATSPFRRRRLKAQLREEKEKEMEEEKMRMQAEIQSLRATLEQVCGDAAIRTAYAEAAKNAALKATLVAKAAEEKARQATERATQIALKQQVVHEEQQAMAAAIQSAGFVVGQKVRARFAGRGHFYPATITAVLAQERYDILYADGDREKGVQKKHLRLILL